MSSQVIDAQFHRAVDIVQSLPKSGPVQTNYEEKLWLYSLYKQATEGDITMPRPGILDMLGRAKWDSWNKQKGVDKTDAKRSYVAALLKILKKYGEADERARQHILEIESFNGPHRAPSPSSSTSSYHSSQASPPESPPMPTLQSQSQFYNPYPLPDPSMPIPDVAPEIVPPSALNNSHRSLLNLLSPQPGPSDHGASAAASVSHLPVYSGSRAHSLRGGGGGSEGRKESVHSLRTGRNQHQPATSAPALGYLSEQPRASGSRPFSPNLPAVRDFATTPDMSYLSPYLGIQQPTPTYPARPGSTSTFSHNPQPSIPQTLQQIQISLTALHERLSTLERSQALILRREDRKRRWSLFNLSRNEADELDELEDEAERARWGVGTNTNTATTTRVRRKKSGLTLRLVWFLIASIRRALLDVGVGMMVMLVAVVVLGGGWRRGRLTLSRLLIRTRRFVQDL